MAGTVIYTLLVSIIGTIVWKLVALNRKTNTYPLPPGPPKDPIIGHVRYIPAKNPELTYIEWGKQYNTDIIYLSLLGQPVVVLNKAEDAVGLLEKRGANYSDRPPFHFFQEQGWKKTLTLFSRGADFRKHRKMYNTSFTIAKCVAYQSVKEDEARKMVKRIIANPADWLVQIHAYTTAVVLRIAYGIEITSEDDQYVKIAAGISDALSNGGSPGSTMVDVFPLIRNLPHWVSFIPSLKFARDHRANNRKMHALPYEHVKKVMASGSDTQSFVRGLVEDRAANGKTDKSTHTADEVTDEDIEGAGATLYTAAQDTSYSTISIFVLAMVLNPEVQRKAQEEIDAVVSANQFPTFADRPKLQYVERILQETFRWNLAVPLTVPHKSSEEDVYKGYRIPKGSLVVANAYAIHRDPTVYKDPDKFNPDRYLHVSEGGDDAAPPIAHFGFGRRICPGQHLGQAAVWIAIATILATLKISKARDKEGNEITPDPGMSTGLTSHPEEFECVVESRGGGLHMEL